MARRGEKGPLDHEEAVSDGAECGVVVEASPGAALEVVEADLLFEFLIVALDSPAELGVGDESAQRSASR